MNDLQCETVQSNECVTVNEEVASYTSCLSFLPFENILSLSRRRNVLARLMQVCEDVEQEQECATVEEVTKLSIILSFNQAEGLLMLFKIC